MTAPGAHGTPGGDRVPPRPAMGRVVAIGCFMAWIGAFSGAMVAVLVSKAVAWFGKMPTCDGIPSCDWYIYAAVGGVLGAISLPWLVVSALVRSAPPASDAGAGAPSDK
jgi:hypothetical protein